jgi:hypothetical protein
MELTIKKLAAYLPYGLKVWHKDNEKSYPLVVSNNTLSLLGGLNIDDAVEYKTKPILYPLDYFEYDHIIQVKEHLGLGQWCDHYDQYFDAWFDDAANVDKLVLQAPFEIFEFFLDIKLDVFNLIENDLAIAVTEDFNPYK